MYKYYLLVMLLFHGGLFAQTTWVVSNSPGFAATFYNLQEAINDNRVVPGDILLVQGSTANYGDIVITKRLTIMGPGYFLDKNPETQVSVLSAQVNTIIFKQGSEGSILQGMSVVGSLPRVENPGYGWCLGRNVNDFGSYGVELNASKITLVSNQISGHLILHNSSFNQVRNCFLAGCSVNDSSINNSISNNIFTNTVQINNASFSNNLVLGVWYGHHFFIKCKLQSNQILAAFSDTYCAGYRIAITDCTTSNNLYSWAVAEGSEDYGSFDFSKEWLGQGSPDGTYKSKPGSLSAQKNIGPFVGPFPYKLSGIALHPNIFSVSMPQTVTSGGGLKVEVKVRAND